MANKEKDMTQLRNTALALLSTLIMGTQSVLANQISTTELHAILGVITNFILDDSTITHNGITYGKVTSPYTGRVWLDRNLGATQVCTSFDDTECYGDYYQWGRNHDGHEKSSSLTSTIQATALNSVGTDFIIGNSDWTSLDILAGTRGQSLFTTDGSFMCPVGFRMPTLSELNAELLDEGSAEIANNNDAFNSFLKLPSAGIRYNLDGVMHGVGIFGAVWSLSPIMTNAFSFHFELFTATLNSDVRAMGLSIRCLKN